VNRDVVTQARRIVIKIGSSSLTGKDGAGLNSAAVSTLVDAVAQLKRNGKEVIVVSSGAIAAGLAPLGLNARPQDLATQQAAASVGQGLLIHSYTESFRRHSITASQVLLTIEDIVRRSHYQNAQRTLFKLLQLGVVPIINENDSVGTQEIRFGDNDRIAALVSHLVGADLLVLVSDVDGLYDAPPSQPGAKKILRVESIDEVAGAETSKKSSRLLWLAHAATPRGRLILDAGAVTALKERGVSLLPAGVTGVNGEFSSGDTVEIAAADGTVIARGLVAFDSEEIPMMLGRSTKDLAKELGPEYERELVHRDDMVLL